jgi:hypothetical protein
MVLIVSLQSWILTMKLWKLALFAQNLIENRHYSSNHGQNLGYPNLKCLGCWCQYFQ